MKRIRRLRTVAGYRFGLPGKPTLSAEVDFVNNRFDVHEHQPPKERNTHETETSDLRGFRILAICLQPLP